MSIKHDPDEEDWCPKCDQFFIEPITCGCFPKTIHPKGKKPLDRALKELSKQKERTMSDTKDLAVKQDHAVTRTESITWTQEQTQLIKDTICKGASDSELKLFLHVSQKTGLDPFVRQIYSIARWDSRLGKEVHQTMVSIDGARLTAERSGKYKGQLGPFWCGEDGEWKEVWLSKNPPSASKVGILRSDFDQPLWGVATWNQYVQIGKSGPTPMWSKMGPVMLAKCAEMLALRKAFPQDLSGLYSQEEMDQASNGQDENFNKSNAGKNQTQDQTPPPADKKDPPKDPPKDDKKTIAASKGAKKNDVIDGEVVDKKKTPEEEQIAKVLELSAKATEGMDKAQKTQFMNDFWGGSGMATLNKKFLGQLKDITKIIQKHLDEKAKVPPPSGDEFNWSEN